MFYFSRGEQLVLVVLLGALLSGAGALTYARGRRAGQAGAQGPLLVEAAGRAGHVLVNVSGAVAEPGLHRLPAGSRVADAIARAGGPTPGARLEAVNQAATVRDGDHIVVPAEQASAGQPVGRISLNRATARELEALPGIGPVLAQRIVDHRERLVRERGAGFRSIEELLNVPGIGPGRLAAIRDEVTL